MYNLVIFLAGEIGQIVKKMIMKIVVTIGSFLTKITCLEKYFHAKIFIKLRGKKVKFWLIANCQCIVNIFLNI